MGTVLLRSWPARDSAPASFAVRQLVFWALALRSISATMAHESQLPGGSGDLCEDVAPPTAAPRRGPFAWLFTDDPADASAVDLAGASEGASDEEIRRYAAQRIPELTAKCDEGLDRLLELPEVERAVAKARLLEGVPHPLESVSPSGRLQCLDRQRRRGFVDSTPATVGVGLDLVENLLNSVFVYGIPGSGDILAAGHRLVGYLRQLFAVLVVSDMERPRDHSLYEEMVRTHYIQVATVQRSALLHRAYLNVIVEEDARRGTSGEARGKRRRV